jgi:hypothetical protein
MLGHRPPRTIGAVAQGLGCGRLSVSRNLLISRRPWLRKSRKIWKLKKKTIFGATCCLRSSHLRWRDFISICVLRFAWNWQTAKKLLAALDGIHWRDNGFVIRLYHRTSAQAAGQIQMDGFRDGKGTYLTDHEFTGVWVSLVPLDCNQGANGDVLLELSADITLEDIADYEWVEDGKTYREWLVPASLLNARCTIRVVS